MKRITSILLALVMILSVMMVSITSVGAAISMENVMACQDKPSDFNEFISLFSSLSQKDSQALVTSSPKVSVDGEGNPVCVYGNVVLDGYTLDPEEFADKYGSYVTLPNKPIFTSGPYTGAIHHADCNIAYNAVWQGFAGDGSWIMNEGWEQSDIYKIRYISKNDLYVDENVQLCVSKSYDSLQHWYDAGIINSSMTNSEKWAALKADGFWLWVEIIVEPEMQDIPVATFKSRLASVKSNNPPSSDNTDLTNVITQSGNDGKSIVTLDYETANLRVTVPTVLPVSVDSDNNVTVSDNAKIVNNSKGQVDVTNAVLSGNNSWTLAAFDTDFTRVPVDTKQYGFKLQGYSVPVNGNAYNNQFDTIAGNAALDLSYDANVAIQSEAISAAEIGNIVFTVAWHK